MRLLAVEGLRVKIYCHCGSTIRGRLYIDGLDGELRCFIPDGEPVDREVLRSRPEPSG
ncbi:hypothetical protein [Sorangium sp. So ce131]|uniref:hypothetical protein n=1 Tax=Sorangium sp. So ce131 TaxID=3133282 RepID=UPI003F5F6647